MARYWNGGPEKLRELQPCSYYKELVTTGIIIISSSVYYLMMWYLPSNYWFLTALSMKDYQQIVRMRDSNMKRFRDAPRIPQELHRRPENSTYSLGTFFLGTLGSRHNFIKVKQRCRDAIPVRTSEKNTTLSNYPRRSNLVADGCR